MIFFCIIGYIKYTPMTAIFFSLYLISCAAFIYFIVRIVHYNRKIKPFLGNKDETGNRQNIDKYEKERIFYVRGFLLSLLSALVFFVVYFFTRY